MIRAWFAHQGQLSILLGLFMLLGGCASSPPSSFYTLSSLNETSELSTVGATHARRLAISLGPVSFPRFLDRPQVVQREDGNQLALDEFHRWGGSLDDDFLRVWSENLAGLLGTQRILVFPSEVRLPLDFRVIADVLDFQAGPGDQARLKVRWAVLNPHTEQVLNMREDLYREALPAQASVSQQVAGLSATLAAFSADVAGELQRLPRPRPPDNHHSD